MIHDLVARARDPTTSDEEVEKSIYQYAATVLAQEGRHLHQAFVNQQAKRKAHERAMHESMQQNMLKNPAYAEMVAKARAQQEGASFMPPSQLPPGHPSQLPPSQLPPGHPSQLPPSQLPPAEEFGDFHDKGTSLMDPGGFEMYPPPSSTGPPPHMNMNVSPPSSTGPPPHMNMNVSPHMNMNVSPPSSTGPPPHMNMNASPHMNMNVSPPSSTGQQPMPRPVASANPPMMGMGMGQAMNAPPNMNMAMNTPHGPSPSTSTDGSYMPSFGAVMGGMPGQSPGQSPGPPHAGMGGMGPQRNQPQMNHSFQKGPAQHDMRSQPGFNMAPPGSRRAKGGHYESMMGPGNGNNMSSSPQQSQQQGGTGDIPMPKYLAMQSETYHEGTPVF